MGRGQTGIDEAIVGADGTRYRRARRRAAAPLELPKTIEPLLVEIIDPTDQAPLLAEYLSGHDKLLNFRIKQTEDPDTRSTYWMIEDPRFTGQRFTSYDEGKDALRDVLQKTPWGGTFSAHSFWGDKVLASGGLAGWMRFKLKPEVTVTVNGERTDVAIEGIAIGSISPDSAPRVNGWIAAGLKVSYRFVVEAGELKLQIVARQR